MENASLKLELNSNFMACKEGQFDVVELMVNNQFKAFSINLKAKHANGMTPFNLKRFIRYSTVFESFDFPAK